MTEFSRCGHEICGVVATVDIANNWLVYAHRLLADDEGNAEAKIIISHFELREMDQDWSSKIRDLLAKKFREHHEYWDNERKGWDEPFDEAEERKRLKPV